MPLEASCGDSGRCRFAKEERCVWVPVRVFLAGDWETAAVGKKEKESAAWCSGEWRSGEIISGRLDWTLAAVWPRKSRLELGSEKTASLVLCCVRVTRVCKMSCSVGWGAAWCSRERSAKGK